jgi:hypothetical protein
MPWFLWWVYYAAGIVKRKAFSARLFSGELRRANLLTYNKGD